jgi:hypothetical protein
MTASDDALRPPPRSAVDRRRDVDFRRAQRARARRRVVRRRRSVAGLVGVSLIALMVVLLTSGSPAARPRAPAPTAAAAGHHATRGSPAAASTGSFPQTHAYPSATTAEFRSLMASLWAGVVQDSHTVALPAFFPLGAYVHLKAISDPTADWTNRLVHDYNLDIAAAHALLGSHAASARLLSVDVISSYGHWIPPGVCVNSIGYYEMPNARVIYREDGHIRSFGIASMISWRGVWYVVHFGGIRRSAGVGMVDDAAVGPGASAYSGTC